jgi:cytochrome b involved in lipid metabolism
MEKLTLVVGLSLILAVFALTFGCVGDTTVSGTVPTTQPVAIQQQTNETIVYTMEQIALHSTPEDCWLVIDGSIIKPPANFASMHKGGAAFLAYCGKDATQAFDSIKDGEGHPIKAKEYMAAWVVGKVA